MLCYAIYTLSRHSHTYTNDRWAVCSEMGPYGLRWTQGDAIRELLFRIEANMDSHASSYVIHWFRNSLTSNPVIERIYCVHSSIWIMWQDHHTFHVGSARNGTFCTIDTRRFQFCILNILCFDSNCFANQHGFGLSDASPVRETRTHTHTYTLCPLAQRWLVRQQWWWWRTRIQHNGPLT